MMVLLLCKKGIFLKCLDIKKVVHSVGDISSHGRL